MSATQRMDSNLGEALFIGILAHRRRAALADGVRGAGDGASCAPSPSALALMPRLLFE